MEVWKGLWVVTGQYHRDAMHNYCFLPLIKKKGLPIKFSCVAYCLLLLFFIQLLFAYSKNHVDIWLVILFLSRKKYHAKHSSSRKLDPGWHSGIIPHFPPHRTPVRTHQGPTSSQRSKIDCNCKSIVVAKENVISQYKSLWWCEMCLAMNCIALLG